MKITVRLSVFKQKSVNFVKVISNCNVYKKSSERLNI